MQKHYRHDGVTADESACRATVAFCGRNMFTLASEIDKIAYYALAHGTRHRDRDAYPRRRNARCRV
ncbi:MAG: hypothetical protein L6V84_06140 [Oscillospiraceae bacterium]|nr:MAG: hypothetical protein L6V84_06140 [Oscillospiraceae bacterium]